MEASHPTHGTIDFSHRLECFLRHRYCTATSSFLLHGVLRGKGDLYQHLNAVKYPRREWLQGVY